MIVFREPAQPVTCLKKIYLHFEVPFECYSLDLSSILFATFKRLTSPRCWMLDGIKKLKTSGKACGFALGEGREQNLCICLI